MTNHEPRVRASDVDTRDTTVGIFLQTPFFCGAFGIFGGIIGAPNVFFERILFKVIIRRADVGVAQMLSNQHERSIVVASGVLVVDNKVHSEFFFEVVKGLLFVADNHKDFINSRCL